MDLLQEIYNRLYRHFGAQKWWPVTPKGKWHPEYTGHLASEQQRFEICLGAILTQNTAWKNVEKAIFNLNKNRLMDPLKIQKTRKEKLAKLIRSAGYFNQKAERIKIFSGYIIRNYDGSLKKCFSKETGALRKELLAIHGIGPETADSIILYSAGKPVFVIDAYTRRIFSRLGLCKENVPYEELQPWFMKNLQPNQKLFNEYHALLVELGKSICVKKPLCGQCPLNNICEFYLRKVSE